MFFKLLIRVTLFFLFLLTFLNASAAENHKEPKIIVSINPIYQIILSITGNRDNIHLLINHNLSEHTYQMKPLDMKNIKNADLVFYISDDLESFMPRIASSSKDKERRFWQLIQVPGLKILPQKNDINKSDIHIWLNPDNAIKIAEFITLKILETDPLNAKKYQLNLQKFTREVKFTADKIHSQIKNIKDHNYMVYHDGYAYFEDYFAIKEIRSITSYEDQELTIKDLKEINQLIKNKNVRCIFGEPGGEKKTAMKIAQNSNIKFAILDLIGDNENYGLNKNGYDYILSDLSAKMHDCLK